MGKKFLTIVAAFYSIYWAISIHETGIMEGYIIPWLLLWVNYGVAVWTVFVDGHEAAVEHLRREGIRYNNKYRYLPAVFYAVAGLILYYVAFRYFDSQGIIWGAVVPAIYLIVVEVVSRFVWASKLSRARRRRRHKKRRG